MKLSIIIPVYFNELNLLPLYEKLKEVVLDNISIDYELIFVDDGSGDDSFKVLKEIKNNNPKVKLLKLSRNFGSHTAIFAGMNYASGSVVCMVTADLQDPPEIILDMLKKYKEGSKLIMAVRADRNEGIVQKTISNLYYKLMRTFALKNMPEGGFDCFMCDRKIVDVICKMEEKNSSLMGQLLWCGFDIDKIYYVRQAREIGKSRWTLSKKIKLFIDSFMAFSYTPIRAISALGIIISLLGFIYGIFVIANKFMHNIPIAGWASMMVVFLFVSGIQMLMLGILGEFLWRSFDETRKRPVYIVDEELGFDDKP
ncbi:MAG: glycosyltransferase family 2 protein [Filifactoraceae bacterium]